MWHTSEYYEWGGACGAHLTMMSGMGRVAHIWLLWVGWGVWHTSDYYEWDGACGTHL